MIKDINQQLARYAKITFHYDLNNFERDVNRRLYLSLSNHIPLKNLVERWVGMPLSISASALFSTLIVGVFLGAQMQGGIIQSKQDALGFNIFSASNTQLPSSLLAPK